jgi:hypothetical protein
MPVRVPGRPGARTAKRGPSTLLGLRRCDHRRRRGQRRQWLRRHRRAADQVGAGSGAHAGTGPHDDAHFWKWPGRRPDERRRRTWIRRPATPRAASSSGLAWLIDAARRPRARRRARPRSCPRTRADGHGRAACTACTGDAGARPRPRPRGPANARTSTPRGYPKSRRSPDLDRTSRGAWHPSRLHPRHTGVRDARSSPWRDRSSARAQHGTGPHGPPLCATASRPAATDARAPCAERADGPHGAGRAGGHDRCTGRRARFAARRHAGAGRC